MLQLAVRRLLLSLRVITVSPWLITGYDIGEVGSCLAVNNSVRTATRCSVKLCSNVSHVQNVGRDAFHVRHSCHRTNIVDCLCSICNNCLSHFRDVFRCCVCRCLSPWTLITAMTSISRAFVPQKQSFILTHSIVIKCFLKHTMGFSTVFKIYAKFDVEFLLLKICNL